MNEMYLLRQMLGSSDWLNVAFLLGLFGIVLFRREAIAGPGMFKLAYVLFAMSILVPAVALPVLNAIGLGQSIPSRFATRSNPMQSDLGFGLSILVHGAGPALFALSVICAFGSLMPRKALSAAPPVKHPLD